MRDSIQASNKNRFHWRTVSVLGTATWLVSTQLAGCAQEPGENSGSAPGEDSLVTGELISNPADTTLGGEGGGGEGEGATTMGTELITDDTAYLTQLGLIRGHLAVGYALYSNDLPELAETHMKHPREEIYSVVVPAFAARGCAGFADNLTALTAAVTERRTKTDVDTEYTKLTNAISACEAGANTSDLATIASVIENLLRTGGVEYEIGIVETEVNNLHEYQDAWGFTQIALDWARSEAFLNDATATAVAAQFQDIIMDLEPMWPSLNPIGDVDADAAQLYGAAAQVQVAAFNLNR